MTKIAKPSNSITVTGTLVDHSLVVRESQNNRTFINGKIVLDTSVEPGQSNEVTLNVLQFADKRDKNDKSKMVPDDRFQTVANLLENGIGNTVRVSASYNNSVFLAQSGEAVKGSQMQAGFFSTSNPGKFKSDFKVTGVIKRIEPEMVQEQETGNVIVALDVFNYNGSMIIPKTFVVDKDNVMAKKYFLESGQIDAGDVTDLWGRIENQTTTKFVESAWGETQEVEGNSRLVAIITGARKTPYDLDEDLEEQVKGARQAYNVFVDEQIKNAQERKAKKEAESGISTTKSQETAPKKGQFDF